VNFLQRILLVVASATAALIVAVTASSLALGVLTALLVGLHFLRVGSLRVLAPRFWAICLFAAGIYALQALRRGADPKMSLQIVFVFAAIRLPGDFCMARGIRVPRCRVLYRLFLFAHFTRHFAAILAEEARRMLIARKMAAPRLYRRGGFSSLVHSLTAVFRCSLIRAERFYAAQRLRGIEA
jgi:hypothetical protein